MKNPLSFIKKANRSFNLFLENFHKIAYLLNSYPKEKEKIDQLVNSYPKDQERLNHLIEELGKNLEGYTHKIDDYNLKIDDLLDSYSKDQEKLNQQIEELSSTLEDSIIVIDRSKDIISKYNDDYQVKKDYFFKGKEKLLEDFPIDPDFLYELCVYNNITFLTVLPDKNRIYLKTDEGIILSSNRNLWVLREVFTQNIYLSPKLYEYEEFVLFDVGMHRGYVSLAIGQMDSCKGVYGFEVDPDTFNFALENFALNPKIARKIHPHPFGLSDTQKEVDVHAIPRSDGCTTTENSFSNLDPAEREKYTIIKKGKVKKASEVLNQIIENNNITSKIVLKIDTEGAEYEILDDLSHSGVLDKVDLFMGECHHGIGKLEKYFDDFNLVMVEDYQFESEDISTFYFEREEKT